MKIKIAYSIPVEKEIEMTPEEYCEFNAGYNDHIFPKEATHKDYNIADQESQIELCNFIEMKNKERLKKIGKD